MSPADTELITLSAFTVSANHDSRSLGASLIGGNLRSRATPSPRPSPPPGARFASGAESTAGVRDNDFLAAAQNPLSTFSIATETAGYAFVRRLVESGQLPPRETVRIEELLNYFSYGYPAPAEKRGGGTPPTRQSADAPFAASLEVAEAPWAPTHRLVRIGLRGRDAERPSGGQVGGALATIAKDVKIQVEFNPAKVASYRLIGYENRPLKKEDFNNDKVDAGDIAAGHTVTALYEIVPASSAKGAKPEPREEVAELRYQYFSGVSDRVPAPNGATGNELLTVKIRFKKPDGLLVRKIEFPLTDSGAKFADATGDFKFAAAVAEFGMLLRESPHRGSGTIGDVIAWAAAGAAGRANDPLGHRGEFIELARRTQALMH